MAEEVSVSELLAACKNVAIDIRKVRDLVQGSAVQSMEAQSVAGQLAAHVTQLMEAAKDADAAVAEARPAPLRHAHL